MPNPPHMLLAPLLAAAASALAGCTATADLAYGEYQFGPGYRTERVYESRVYGDAAEGFGGEACRSVSRRGVNDFGEVVVRETRVCGEAPGY